MNNKLMEIRNDELQMIDGGKNSDYVDGYVAGRMIREFIFHIPSPTPLPGIRR